MVSQSTTMVECWRIDKQPRKDLVALYRLCKFLHYPEGRPPALLEVNKTHG
jgi:hypothetical protein